MILDRIFEDGDRAVKKATLSLAELHKSVFAKFLDCGPGNGRFTMALKWHLGISSVFVADCQPKRLIEAREGNGWGIVECDLNQGINYPDDMFDVIHAGQIIEHLSDTDTFMREMYRALKPGGYCLISTPNLASWHNIVWLLMGKQPHVAMVSDEIIRHDLADDEVDEPKHRRIFTPEGLRMLMEHHGFHVVTMRGAGYYPFPGILGRLLSRVDAAHAAYVVAKGRKVDTI